MSYTDRAPDGTYLREDDGLGDDRAGTQAFQPSIPPLEPECDCPAGAWHLRSCDLVYWPADDGEEEEEEEDGDE